jgi:hypothetical protein
MIWRGYARASATADLGVIAYETPSEEGLVVEEEILLETVRPGTGDPVAGREVVLCAANALPNDDKVADDRRKCGEAGWQPGGAGG